MPDESKIPPMVRFTTIGTQPVNKEGTCAVRLDMVTMVEPGSINPKQAQPGEATGMVQACTILSLADGRQLPVRETVSRVLELLDSAKKTNAT